MNLAKATGDFETLDEHARRTCASGLEERAEQEADQQAENTLVQELVSGSTFEVPDVLIEEQAQRLEQREAFEAAQRGIPKEYYLQMINLSEEEWKAAPSGARRRYGAQFHCALDAVASQEEINVPTEEIDGEVEQKHGNLSHADRAARTTSGHDRYRETAYKRASASTDCSRCNST